MARIFTVECPSCRESFPCHTELWHTGYDLLCPYCQTRFSQENSPRVVSPEGETQRVDTGDVDAT